MIKSVFEGVQDARGIVLVIFHRNCDKIDLNHKKLGWRENKLKEIKAVLFDFDGTIMDTNQVIINSWQYAFEKLKGEKAEVEELLKTFGEPLDLSIDKLLPGFPKDEAISTYREYQYHNFKGLIELFPGTLEIMRELKENDIKTAIVTSRLRRTTMEGIEKFSLEHLLDTIVTMEDTKKHKPHGDPILEALKRLEIKPENALMVGDTKFDILCAKDAGVASALVEWSVAATVKGDDVEWEADYTINKLEDIMKIINL